MPLRIIKGGSNISLEVNLKLKMGRAWGLRALWPTRGVTAIDGGSDAWLGLFTFLSEEQQIAISA
jgi:hypothetical protein